MWGGDVPGQNFHELLSFAKKKANNLCTSTHSWANKLYVSPTPLKPGPLPVPNTARGDRICIHFYRTRQVELHLEQLGILGKESLQAAKRA